MNYATSDALEVYTTYLALKRHFTSDYDYFEFNGEVKCSVKSFSERKDLRFFWKLSKRKNYFDHILANMIVNPKIWVGDLVMSEECDKITTEFLKRTQAMSYRFKSDLALLDDPYAALEVCDGKYPLILDLYIQGKVCIETLIILDGYFHILEEWDETITERLPWSDINRTCINYRSFFKEAFPKSHFRSTVDATFV